MAGNIFISYRRTGADEHVAGRLHRELGLLMDPARIFMDVDDMPLGVDFHVHLAKKVSDCEIFLSLIGPGWHQDAARLHNPDDFLRIEIETALARPHIRIVPLLIGDAEMPDWESLPASLRPLGRRHGTRLSHDGFVRTIERLARQLGPLPAREDDDHLIRVSKQTVHLDPPRTMAPAPQKSSGRKRGLWPWLLGFAAAGGLAGMALVIETNQTSEEPRTSVGPAIAEWDEGTNAEPSSEQSIDADAIKELEPLTVEVPDQVNSTPDESEVYQQAKKIFLDVGPAFITRSTANFFRDDVKKKHAELLGEYSSHVHTQQEQTTPNEPPSFQVRIGPFQTNAPATALCTRLRAKGQSCIVVQDD